MSAVLHNHWAFSPKLRRVFYLYRDGRDIMVSYYFFRMKRMLSGAATSDRVVYTRLFGNGFDPDDVVSNLPKFIDHEFRSPRDARTTWVKHIDEWYQPEKRPYIAYLSYESLLQNCAAELQKAVEIVTERQIDQETISMTVDKYSMSRQTGRNPGDEDRKSFVRKGIAGDWMNYFTREAAEVFASHASPTLVRLGYEQSESWCSRYTFSDQGGCAYVES
jgi:hypothetical protein